MKKENIIFKTNEITELTMIRDEQGCFNIIIKTLVDNNNIYELHKVQFSDQSELKLDNLTELTQGIKGEVNLNLVGDLL